MTGRFIVFEGGEGSGKSTQARLLAAALNAQGVATVLTREPGGTPGAEAIRKLLLEPTLPNWEIEAEALLFAAARSDHVFRLIRPSLDAGRWVVCDRFVASSRAYQGGAGGLGDEKILALHAVGSGGLMPDRTLWLDLGAAEAAARLDRRDGATADKIGGRGGAFHAAVAETFARLASSEPDRFVRIEAGGPEDEVHRRVVAAIADLIR